MTFNLTHYNALRLVKAGLVSIKTRKHPGYYSFVGVQGASRYLGKALHRRLVVVPDEPKQPRTWYVLSLSAEGEAELARMESERPAP